MAKMKTCKSCNTEVAKSAKTCPKCGAKLKSGLIKKILIFWVVLAALVAIFRNSEENTIASVDNVALSNDSKDFPQLVSIDKKIAINDIRTHIIDIKIQNSFSDYTGILTATAQTGATLVAVLASYENIGKEPINPFSLPDLTLVAPNGTKYDADIGKSSAYAGIRKIDEKVLSDITPGLRSQSVFVFEVSKQLFKEQGWKLKVGSVRNVMYQVN